MGVDWAHFVAGVCGAKVHVIYDVDAEQPIYAAVTAARVNDITAAHAMPIEAGATYVFDLGYGGTARRHRRAERSWKSRFAFVRDPLRPGDPAAQPASGFSCSTFVFDGLSDSTASPSMVTISFSRRSR